MDVDRKAKYKQAKEALIRRFEMENFEVGQKIPTENDLIKDLGFSRNTIRQAVMELVKEGIVRKEQGRGTYFIKGEKRGKTGRIGIINFFMTHHVYPHMMHGIEEVAWQSGYSIIQSHTGNSGERELKAIKRIIDQGVDGIIYEPFHNSPGEKSPEELAILEYLESLSIPIVTTHFFDPRLVCSSVSLDDHMVGYNAVRHLSERGHTRIGQFYIEDVQSGVSRSEGFFRAVGELGLVNKGAWNIVIKAGEVEGSGKAIAEHLVAVLSHADRPSALFCFNDELATMTYEAARSAGLKTGEDISIIGVDNTVAAGILHPGLTTFDHPKDNLGRWAARLLIMHINDRNEKPVQIIFHPELIERDSIADLTLSL